MCIEELTLSRYSSALSDIYISRIHLTVRIYLRIAQEWRREKQYYNDSDKRKTTYRNRHDYANETAVTETAEARSASTKN